MILKTNVHFNNMHTDKVVELYLFYRLRMFASFNGGIFDGFVFTKTEKYDVLPRLKNLGWISENKISKYRGLINRYKCKNIYFNLSEDNLYDLNAFKATLIATTEKYLLDVKQSIVDKKRTKIDSLGKKTKVNWDRLRGVSKALLQTKKKIDDFGIKTISGRAFNDEIRRLMNISESTITRWRKESKEREFNIYTLTTVKYSPNCPVIVNDLLKERIKKNSVYVSKNKGIYTKDLYITSSIDLFKIKILKNA